MKPRSRMKRKPLMPWWIEVSPEAGVAVSVSSEPEAGAVKYVPASTVRRAVAKAVARERVKIIDHLDAAGHTDCAMLIQKGHERGYRAK